MRGKLSQKSVHKVLPEQSCVVGIILIAIGQNFKSEKMTKKQCNYKQKALSLKSCLRLKMFIIGKV